MKALIQGLTQLGKSAYHGTSAKAIKKLQKTNVFNPISGNNPSADIGIHVGLNPSTANKIVTNKSEAAIIPLTLDPKLKPLRIPDVGAFKYPESWLRNLPNSDVPSKLKTELLKAAKTAADIGERNSKVGQRNYFDTTTGRSYWLQTLRNILKKYKFDSFIYKNKHEIDIGMEPLDSIMLLNPRQLKYKTSKTKTFTESEANRKTGGLVLTGV